MILFFFYLHFRKTIELARSLEAAGASFLTLHARTTQERHSPIHEDSLREVCQSLRIPLVANGDVKSLEGATRLFSKTGCKGKKRSTNFF